MRFISLSVITSLLVGSTAFGQLVTAQTESASRIETFVAWLLEEEAPLQVVSFAEVVRATSGCSVLPVNVEDPVDAAMLTALGQAMDQTFESLAQPEHPIHQVGRVNEISRHVEDTLIKALDAMEGLTCGVPVNASGDLQRSGYPDIRLQDQLSGRIFYIDPKVYKAGSETSSFRTFYFEPQRSTNKITEDASHLIVGVSHQGRVGDRWLLQSWRVVDLIDFKVRLKAEFQASNRDLYRADAIILKMED